MANVSTRDLTDAVVLIEGVPYVLRHTTRGPDEECSFCGDADCDLDMHVPDGTQPVHSDCVELLEIDPTVNAVIYTRR
jgi:hypothetical protein